MFLFDRDRLDEAKQRIAANDPTIQPAWDALRTHADAALTERPESVMDKRATPPSGDKHDFSSLAVYWWPNPATPDGLPYLRRDGRLSPKIDEYDWPAWNRTGERVRALALAYYFSGDARYAERAATLMRTWFIDEATAMTPHMRYAACIPGRNEGRCFGIIHFSNNFPSLLDLLELVEETGAWRAEDRKRFEPWLAEFYTWLTTSDRGVSEGNQANNHAVMYDRMIAVVALHLGRQDDARRLLAEVPSRRFSQIQPDGRMPKELGRTRSWHYSVMNLNALFSLARLAQHAGVEEDLWMARRNGHGGLRDAASYLYDHATTGEPWPYEEIHGVEYGLLTPLLEQARAAYGAGFDSDRIAHRLNGNDASQVHHLTGRHREFC